MAQKELKSIKFPGLADVYKIPAGGGSGGGSGGTVTEADIEKALGYKPIGADDVPVKKVNGQTGEVKSTFYVAVTPTGSGWAATADKTPQEVYAAYTAGYAVYAVVKFASVAAPFELPLVAAASAPGTIVLGFGALGSLDPTKSPQYPTAAFTGTAWMAWLGTLARASDIPTIPTALKNPNALNIKIGKVTTSYDGSAEKTVEIPEGTDGYSPSASVTQTDTGATITITDKSGTTTATVKNGKKGEKGDKGDTGETGPQGPAGDDYVLTPEDKTQIAEAVIADGQEVQLGGDVPAPTDAQVSSAVDTWLTEHPEATTTVQDGSVSAQKLAGYSTVCRDVPWELFLDGYGTSLGNTVENAACAIYSVKFEAEKTYCILNLPYPNNTNEVVTDPTDINYFGRYFSYYPSLPDVAANIAAGKDRLYGYKKADNIQQALLKAESDGYVETAIPGQALSLPPVYFTVKQDWYVLRASTKPDAGKRVNNYYVAELQMPGISTFGNGMHGQSWYVYKKDLGNGSASDRGYLQQIFASKTANAENERAYAAMSRDVPRDRTLNIHFIGDSITWAASAGLQNAFRKYVPMNLRAETMALCIPGVSVTTGSGSFDWNQKQNTDAAYDAAMSGYSGLAQKLAEYKTNLSLAAWADAVDIVVVELGTNDHWEQAALGVQTDLTEDTNFYGAVEKTLILLEDTFPHAQILWMLPFKNQKWKTSTVKLVDYLIALKILCQMHTRCWTLDLFDKWFLDYDDTDLRSKFFIDGVHITGNAHKCVAESMIDKIRQIISVCGLRQTETVHVTAANDSVYGSAT